jgi:predicted membrane protein
MGGTEINLTNADINGVVVLDVTQIFGGTKIFIPATWDVSSEMAAIFAGIDDKRSLVNVIPDRSKLLVIKGTSIFGGIEIRNF